MHGATWKERVLSMSAQERAHDSFLMNQSDEDMKIVVSDIQTLVDKFPDKVSKTLDELLDQATSWEEIRAIWSRMEEWLRRGGHPESAYKVTKH